VVLQLGGWAWGKQLLTVKNKLVTKILKKLRTWTDSVDKDLNERKGIWDLVLGMLEVCIGQFRSGQWWKKSQNIS
jgi:hypothetical protein